MYKNIFETLPLQMSINDLNEIRENEAKKVFAKQLYLSILVLNDKFDFTKDQLNSFLKEMLLQYQSIDKEFCTIDDVVETVKKELGINLKE